MQYFCFAVKHAENEKKVKQYLNAVVQLNIIDYINPFQSNGISHSYLLDQNMSILRVAEQTV